MSAIDVSRIPDYARESIANWALNITRDCFEKPGADEEYTEWLKEYRKKGGRQNDTVRRIEAAL